MSEDLRNSLYLWAGGITFALIFWAALHFDVLAGVPDRWLWPTLAVILAINVLQTIWGFWRRRKNSGEGNG